MKTYVASVDGACTNNGTQHARASYGVVINLGESDEIQLAGEIKGEVLTNNVAELTAALVALKYIVELDPNNPIITIVSDSNYVVKGYQSWLDNWVKNGFKTSMNTEVTNIELWKKLYEYKLSHNPQFIWVKGHAGHVGNEMADQLASSTLKNPEPVKEVVDPIIAEIAKLRKLLNDVAEGLLISNLTKTTQGKYIYDYIKQNL